MAPSIKARRFMLLRDHYGSGEYPEEWPDVNARYVSVRDYLGLHATFEEACDELADEILDHGCGKDLAVYDLETGERIELHVSTPIVMRAEDQGVMENPLDA